MSVNQEAIDSVNELEKPHQEEEEEAMDQSSSNQITGLFFQTNYCLDDKGFQLVVGKTEFVSIESEPAAGQLPDPCLDFLKQKSGKNNTNIGQVELIDSCNGLLLCSCVVKPIGSKKSKDANPIIICNPLTKEKVTIPHPSGNYKQLYYALLADLDSGGYIQYKVVCLFSSYSFWKLLVLSSETGEWGEVVGRFPPLSHKIETSSKAYVNGSLYWDCFDGHILVCHLNPKKDQSCYKLIEAPAAPLGRCLWKCQNKLRCYCHGYSGEFLAWSLFLGEKNEFKWELDGCEEFETVTEDISKEIAEGWIVHTRSVIPRVQFEIIGYRHESKTMFLIASGCIFTYQLSDRVLNIIGKFEEMGFYRTQRYKMFQLFNCVLPYVHSLAHIQRKLAA